MSEPEYQSLDRRPINSRNTKWAHQFAAFLASKNITPNAISVFGMLAAIMGGIAFSLTDHSENDSLNRSMWLVGGLLCQVRLLCNLFDGMVAIQQNKASPKGELYNEVPDRVSDAAIFIGLGFASGGTPFLGALAAAAAIFVAYVRAMGKTVGAANDFCGPLAKPQRMALVTVFTVFMAFTPGSWHSQFTSTQVLLWIVIVGCGITAWRRLSRAAKFLENEAQ